LTWICYLLQCADDTLYCGITNDLGKRIVVHNAGEGAKYTRGRTPVRLVYQESCADKSVALKREMQIKRMTRQAKIDLFNL
jgi:putative endonuclease